MKTLKKKFDKEKIQRKVKSNSFYKRFSSWTKNALLSKGHDISLYEFGAVMFKEFKRNDLNTESRALAYSFILALFPGIIFLFSLIPFFPMHLEEEAINQFIHDGMGMQLPTSMSKPFAETVMDIVNKQRNGVTIFSFLFALFLSTNGMVALMDSFNKCYKLSEKRGFIKKRLIAIGLTILLSGVLLISIAVVAISSTKIYLLFEYLEQYTRIDLRFMDQIGRDIQVFENFVFVFLFFITISIIYYFAPATSSRWSFFSKGTIVATALCVGTTAGFSYYLTNYAKYQALYGAIGTLIGFMIWLQLITLMLLIGFEVNTSLDLLIVTKERRKKWRKSPPTLENKE